MKENITIGIIVSIMFIVGLIALISAVDRNDKAKCLRLASQAETYENFYITKWEKEMCDYQNITVNADVK